MRSKKPIKVFWSELGQRFYAAAHYKQEGNHITITGEKFDVTDDIAAAVIKHDIEFKRMQDSNAEARAASRNGQGWAFPKAEDIVKALGSGWTDYTMRDEADAKFVVIRILEAIKKCAPPSEANGPQEGQDLAFQFKEELNAKLDQALGAEQGGTE